MSVSSPLRVPTNLASIASDRVLVLERLSDEDIATIITQAVRRASPTGQEDANATTPHVAAEPLSSDARSSPPPSSPTLVPSQEISSQSSSTNDEQLFPAFPQLTRKIFTSLVSLSTGDARTALSLLELVLASPSVDPDKLLASIRRSVSTSYDRTGDDRYDMISALHKSVRGSNGSAAMYWLARMLTAGEDPVYIARRMAVCASEDVGLADNHALPLVSRGSLSYLASHAKPFSGW